MAVSAYAAAAKEMQAPSSFLVQADCTGFIMFDLLCSSLDPTHSLMRTGTSDGEGGLSALRSTSSSGGQRAASPALDSEASTFAQDAPR